MPRLARVDIGGEVYHVINRANGRMSIFETPEDYKLFERLLGEAKELTNTLNYETPQPQLSPPTSKTPSLREVMTNLRLFLLQLDSVSQVHRPTTHTHSSPDTHQSIWVMR